jgi:multidrug efflux pump subunit AcrB
LVIEAPKESAGSYSLGLSVTDPDNNKGTVTLSVKVIDYPKSKPVITELSQISFRSDQVYSLPLNKVITDEDTQLDKIVWEISGNKKVKVSINPGKQISFSALAKDFEGTELITLTATDPEKQSDKKSVLV